MTFRQLIPAKAIAERTDELAAAYLRHYGHLRLQKPVVTLAVLHGATQFALDFNKAITGLDHRAEPELDTIQYHSVKHQPPRSLKTPSVVDLEDRHVVIVEDILGTGQTLLQAWRYVEARGAASVAIAVLLQRPRGVTALRRASNKLGRVHRPIFVNFPGFTIDSGFVVGYGLGLGHQYRAWPDIYARVDNYPHPKYTTGVIRRPSRVPLPIAPKREPETDVLVREG